MWGQGGLTGCRFGFLTTIVQDDLRPAPAAAFEAARTRLEAAGAIVEDVAAPEIEGPMADAGLLYTAEAWGVWGSEIAERGEVMFAPIRERFASDAAYKAADYVAAWRRLDAARATWAARMARFDAVLAPTVANLPPNADRLMKDGDYYVTENLLTLRNTRVGNLMGVSALTLPTDTPPVVPSTVTPPPSWLACTNTVLSCSPLPSIVTPPSLSELCTCTAAPLAWLDATLTVPVLITLVPDVPDAAARAHRPGVQVSRLQSAIASRPARRR